MASLSEQSTGSGNAPDPRGVFVGTCSWSGEGLRGTFYPQTIEPREMITFYAQHFRVVEVDATYYHMPREQNSRLWAERTPEGFIFDVKAYRELTRHDRNVEPSPDTFARFASALRPLQDAGKLGVLLFQFPPWFTRRPENRDYILACRDYLPDFDLAIEFRHGSWLRDGADAETLPFLRKNGLAFVCVDEPQIRDVTLPPIAAVTADVAVVRFHGRNRQTWFKRNITVEERFNYLYTPEELAEWKPRIEKLAQAAQQVHVLMNNCYNDYSVRNARDMERLLA